MKEKIDLTGKRFTRLTVLEKVGTSKWKCRCDCGKTVISEARWLLVGRTKSCGCYIREMKKNLRHGMATSKLYHAWQGMNQRCYNKNNRAYSIYGGRGIKVCDDWKDFKKFRDWALLNGYDERLGRSGCTIDRIDVNGNYCPENCRWIGMKEQTRNRRTNKVISFNGEKHCLSEWEEKLHFNAGVIYGRLKKGFTIEEAILVPFGLTRKQYYRLKGGKRCNQ